MSSVQAAPPPAPAPAPAAAPAAGGGGAPAPAGGGGGAPAAQPKTVGATKGAGGTGGGGGGGSASAQDGDTEKDAEGDLTSLGRDRTAESTLNILSAAANGTITMQAAMTHLQQGEGRSKRSAETAAFRMALSKTGLRIGKSSGTMASHMLAATVSALENFREHTPADALYGSVGLAAAPLQFAGDTVGEEQLAPARQRRRGELNPALPHREVQLTGDLRPRVADEEAHLRELIADPRAGFAPEGLAAWQAERKKRIVLTRSLQGRNDFTEVGNGARWWIVSGTDAKVLRRAAREADLAGIHLVVDATAKAPPAHLGGTLRDLSTMHPKVRMHVAVPVA